MGVIYVVGLRWLATSTCHFTNDQGPAQLFHDISEFLSSTCCHTTGQDGYTLLGAISFTWRTEAVQYGVKSAPTTYTAQMPRGGPHV